MIHYHGAPCTPNTAGLALYTRRHACVSFAHPAQLPLIAEVAQSFMLDNGAFTLWKRGEGTVDVTAYAEWVRRWHRHPGFDFCLIPDDIDGDEAANDMMLARWRDTGLWKYGVPVWHLHESLERLDRMSRSFDRIALGSSGRYAVVGNGTWWARMSEAMDTICDDGMPRCKLHGLRMLNPTIFSQLPLSSADSTNVARNIGIDAAWDRAAYAPASKEVRALVLADRIEHHGSAARWNNTRGVEMNLELFG